MRGGTKIEMDRDLLREIDQVEDYLPDEPEHLDDEILICECFCVSVKDIRQEFEETGKVDVQLLQDRFSLGHGCQSCMKRIDSWINKIF